MGVIFPNESKEYREARNRLLAEEIALRRQMEAVAASRRALPAGGETPEDYRFEGVNEDGRPTMVRLSELFGDGDTILIYHMMFPRYSTDTREAAAHGETARLPVNEQPCPSCTALLDQLDAAAAHYQAGGGRFFVVAKTAIGNLAGLARDRGWRNLQLLSAGKTSFKRDYQSERDGESLPVTTVFQRGADGAIRHFWSSELTFAQSDPGQDPRAQGTIEPFWNMFDLTPNGRPNFDEQLQYDGCGRPPAQAAS